MKQPAHALPVAALASRVLGVLAMRDALGLCLFESSGIVTAQIGAGAGFLPGEGGDIAACPLFVGLEDSLLALKTDGGFISLPSIGINASSDARFDVQICWLDEEALFAVLLHPATQRIGVEFRAAQASRENRLLLEKIKQQQEQIVAQNQLMRIFVTHVPAAVAMLDEDLNYLMLSRRWEDDFGVKEGGITQKPFAVGVPEKLGRRWQAGLQRGGGTRASGIEKTVAADGSPGWHRWERQNWPSTGGHPGGTLVFSENITRSVEQTARLRGQAANLAALNQEMRQFSLAVSHDLRAPIRQISAFARFMAEEHAAGAGGKWPNTSN